MQNESIDQTKWEKVIGETLETKNSSLSLLRAGLLKHNVTISDDEILIRFLRSSRYDVQDTQTKILNYINVRSNTPEWYSNRDPSNAKFLELFDVFLPLKQRDKEGQQIIFCRPGMFNPYRQNVDDLMKFIFMVIDMELDDNLTQLCGFTFIVDLTSFSWCHLSCWGPSIVKKTLNAWQQAYPIRVRALHHYNEPWLFDGLFAIIRPFLKKKILQRFFLHGSGTEKLCQHISRELLPTEYGGLHESMLEMKERYVRKWLAHKTYFMEPSKYSLQNYEHSR